MTDVQEVFNRVIDQKYYDTSHTNSAMCNSLHYAQSWWQISKEEYLFAKQQIKEYLLPTNCAYLQKALEKAGLPSTIQARTDLYRDWANRPKLLKEQAAGMPFDSYEEIQ